LKDGDGTKTSTNGTWLFAGDEERIPTGDERGVIFKAGATLFRVVSQMNNAGAKYA
jgi:hypothetical protein